MPTMCKYMDHWVVMARVHEDRTGLSPELTSLHYNIDCYVAENYGLQHLRVVTQKLWHSCYDQLFGWWMRSTYKNRIMGTNTLSQYQIFIFLVLNLKIISTIWYINPSGFKNQLGLPRHVGVHHYVIIGECYAKLSEWLYDRHDYADAIP